MEGNTAETAKVGHDHIEANEPFEKLASAASDRGVKRQESGAGWRGERGEAGCGETEGETGGTVHVGEGNEL